MHVIPADWLQMTESGVDTWLKGSQGPRIIDLSNSHVNHHMNQLDDLSELD